ncbi:MAG TPA: 16S rRNA (adenine(1518)-N(6)/adenine(1519)-N(6))-dimethyltransferase RsmA [Terrimicrobiaceae bacterium]
MTRTEIQDALSRLGARPRKSLGQNFLHDANLARWIVARLGIEAGDHIVEIGPGLGALTGLLLREGVSLTLIEKDERMVEWLRGRFGSEHVELFHVDALDFDLRTLYGRGPVKIIGNLPYYVSTPLIAKYASALSPASILVLTLQREVVERLVAVPRTKQFGAMTVCASRRWNIRCAKKLSPSVFLPEPQVSSAVVIFERKATSDIAPCDEMLFESLVRRGFAERRKQLRNLLAEHKDHWSVVCAALGVKETVRGEELSLGEWERLSQLLQPATAQHGSEMLCVVDEHDRVIGFESRDLVHVNNLRHRAIHILIFNQRGELFLQKRSIWKDTHPGKWDSSTAGHVDAGESYEESARRELHEEIGIECSIERIGKLPCSEATGWEFIEVFRGKHEGPFHLAPMEIDTGAFFPLDKIRTWLKRSPEDFSPVFAMCLDVLSD